MIIISWVEHLGEQLDDAPVASAIPAMGEQG